MCYEEGKAPELVSENTEINKQESMRFKPAKRDNLRVGVVGVGGFAKVMLMPIIAQLPGVHINAVVDANTSRSLTLSRLYGAAKSLVDDISLFKEDLIDVVVIASPHKYHCEQAMHALQHGKAVFLEKPMVTDVHQLDILMKYLKEHEQVPCCVD